MIGLFLPRLRVVSLLRGQPTSTASAPNRPTQFRDRSFRSGPFALISNNEQDGSGDVSTRI
jgi:hypothetical protein